MVRMYNVSTPPLSQPERFEIQSEAEDDDWYSARMVSASCFDMAAGDDVSCRVGEMQDD